MSQWGITSNSIKMLEWPVNFAGNTEFLWHLVTGQYFCDEMHATTHKHGKSISFCIDFDYDVVLWRWTTPSEIDIMLTFAKTQLSIVRNLIFLQRWTSAFWTPTKAKRVECINTVKLVSQTMPSHVSVACTVLPLCDKWFKSNWCKSSLD